MRVLPSVIAGRVGLEVLQEVAATAFAQAGRPRWSSPLVVAFELGFRLLPCAPDTRPELERTTADQIVFAAEAGEEDHATRVRLALARGLLLRAGIAHGAADAYALARLLRQNPE